MDLFHAPCHGNRSATFDSSDFKKLEKDVDAFSIMTYDYSQTGR